MKNSLVKMQCDRNSNCGPCKRMPNTAPTPNINVNVNRHIGRGARQRPLIHWLRLIITRPTAMIMNYGIILWLLYRSPRRGGPSPLRAHGYHATRRRPSWNGPEKNNNNIISAPLPPYPPPPPSLARSRVYEFKYDY